MTNPLPRTSNSLAQADGQAIGNKYTTKLAELDVILKNTSMATIRRVLGTIFKSRDIVFVTGPIVYYRVRYQGKNLIISDKKTAAHADLITGELALGYEELVY